MNVPCPQLSFRPINLKGNQERLISFARDLFTFAYGNDEKFERSYGADGAGYIGWIWSKLMSEPGSAVFATIENVIAGMVVIGAWHADPSYGYVNHYYLTKEWRGRGLGTQLDHHAMNEFQARGYERARLSVALSNSRAVRLYTKLGWVEAEPRTGYPGLHYFERIVEKL